MLATKIPVNVPAFSVIVADLGQPSAAEIARALGVTPRTVQRWIEIDLAPTAATLALFWLTRCGMSQIECRAVNDARLQAALARAHQRDAETRLAQVQHLLQVGDFAAANAPLMRA